MPDDLGWRFSTRFKRLCLQTIKNHINLNCQRRNGFQKPNGTSTALFRKDLEADTEPPAQMPADTARKPKPAASAAYDYWCKTKVSGSFSFRWGVSVSASVSVRSWHTTRKMTAPQKCTPKWEIAAIRPVGNQWLGTLSVGFVFPTNRIRHKN